MQQEALENVMMWKIVEAIKMQSEAFQAGQAASEEADAVAWALCQLADVGPDAKADELEEQFRQHWTQRFATLRQQAKLNFNVAKYELQEVRTWNKEELGRLREYMAKLKELEQMNATERKRRCGDDNIRIQLYKNIC